MFGVLALLGQAIYRLLPLALEPLQTGMLSRFEFALYVGWSLANAYLEGYRGFQRRFSPRVVARAAYLGQNPKPWHVAFAPLFCMSFFHASRRGLISAWGMTTFVLLAIALVRMVPQPWRGIIDAGVVVGLVWGVVSTLLLWVGLLAGQAPASSGELPTETVRPSA